MLLNFVFERITIFEVNMQRVCWGISHRFPLLLLHWAKVLKRTGWVTPFSLICCTKSGRSSEGGDSSSFEAVQFMQIWTSYFSGVDWTRIKILNDFIKMVDYDHFWRGDVPTSSWSCSSTVGRWHKSCLIHEMLYFWSTNSATWPLKQRTFLNWSRAKD